MAKKMMSKEKVKLKNKIVLASLFFLTACAGPRLLVESMPNGANVYVTPLGTSVPKLVGQTPLHIPLADLNPETWGSGPVYLEVQKETFMPEKVFVTELSKVHTELRFTLMPASQFKEGRQIDDLVEGIFYAQQLMKDKRYDDALTKLKELEGRAPDVSVIYEMQGAVYLAKNKMGEALVAYRLAVKYNPGNVDAVKMKRYIEANHFGRGVSSEESDE